MLGAQNRQGKFGEDYIRVMASAAGLIVSTFDLDIDGIDLGLRWPGRVGNAASPAIDVQVKSWSKSRRSGGFWHYDGLNEVQFNKLVGPDYTVPRFLFLVVVPSDARLFAEVGIDGLLLRHHGYYLSLRHEVSLAQPDRNRRRPVQVPVANVLTASSILSLFRPDLAMSEVAA